MRFTAVRVPPGVSQRATRRNTFVRFLLGHVCRSVRSVAVSFEFFLRVVAAPAVTVSGLHSVALEIEAPHRVSCDAEEMDARSIDTQAVDSILLYGVDERTRFGRTPRLSQKGF